MNATKPLLWISLLLSPSSQAGRDQSANWDKTDVVAIITNLENVASSRFGRATSLLPESSAEGMDRGGLATEPFTPKSRSHDENYGDDKGLQDKQRGNFLIKGALYGNTAGGDLQGHL